MRFGEFNCECGANVCGDPDRHTPECPTCGKMGSWDKVTENDLMSALEDTDTPDPLEGAIIYPDDPIPPRESDDDENLMERFEIAMATMNRYNQIREANGLPPLSIEELGE